MLVETIKIWGEWFFMNWLEALWLPLSLICVHKGQKLKSLAFVILCMMVMRLQIEIVQSTGFKDGFTGLWHWPIVFRGYAVYGLFTFMFLVLSWFSPRTSGAIYLAASLSIFFMAFVVSSVVLII